MGLTMENDLLAITSAQYDAESKFGIHKGLIVLNILKNKCCVNKLRDMSSDHFSKYFKQ